MINFLGSVGLSLNGDWTEPRDVNNKDDIEAAEMNRQFFIGWFAHPIFIDGQYPSIMREKVQKFNFLPIILL